MTLSWHVADLKKAIYAIFSQFGKILDVVALKTYRLRGQAWVVFADIRSAGEAIRTMQGFPFFDKPMVRDVMHCSRSTVHANINHCTPACSHKHLPWSNHAEPVCLLQRITYAKTKSDALAKAEGTYVEKDKAARQKHNAEQRGEMLSLVTMSDTAAFYLP